MDINTIANSFCLDGEPISIKEFGSGHINSTYIVDCGAKHYVVQKINNLVFKDVDGLMNNVFAVTDYLKEAIAAEGGDVERETLNFVNTKDGKKYLKTPEGEYYRAYVFVKDSMCYDSAKTPEMFKMSALAFGRFQKMLGSFPAEELTETIEHFHDTRWRYDNEFKKALLAADESLRENCANEIAFVTDREDMTSVVTSLIEKGELPVRVTHNDTKLNNVLFDENTGKSLAVIDLDTVMPGSALYDFGDSIRFGASTAAEDETDLDKVSLDLDYFAAYAQGYLAEAGDTLCQQEKDLLAFSAVLITFELGMRFLTDYLSGSVYFKTDYPEHNLDRAKNQFKLVSDMESKLEQMNKIISEI